MYSDPNIERNVVPQDIMDRSTLGSIHLLDHLPGTPEKGMIDEAAVEAGLSAFTLTHDNFMLAWKELESQQPNLVSVMLEVSTGFYPDSCINFLNTLFLDEIHSDAPTSRVKIVSGLLAADRIIRSWSADSDCRIAGCLYNNHNYNRLGGVVKIPLNSAFATMYDDLFTIRHWFRDVVSMHVGRAFDRIRPDDLRVQTTNYGGSSAMDSKLEWQRDIGVNVARDNRMSQAGKYALLFADSFNMVSFGNRIIRATDVTCAPPNPKGSY